MEYGGMGQPSSQWPMFPLDEKRLSDEYWHCMEKPGTLNQRNVGDWMVLLHRDKLGTCPGNDDKVAMDGYGEQQLATKQTGIAQEAGSMRRRR